MVSAGAVLMAVIGVLWLAAVTSVAFRVLSRRGHLSGGAPTSASITSSVAGVVVAAGVWLALVPWDLSTANAQGYPLVPRRFDENRAALAILVVIGVVALGGALLAAIRRRGALAFTLSGCITWLVLYAWRYSVANVDGANFWAVGFVLLAVPVASAACVIVTIAVVARERAFLKRSLLSR